MGQCWAGLSSPGSSTHQATVCPEALVPHHDGVHHVPELAEVLDEMLLLDGRPQPPDEELCAVLRERRPDLKARWTDVALQEMPSLTIPNRCFFGDLSQKEIKNCAENDKYL